MVPTQPSRGVQSLKQEGRAQTHRQVDSVVDPIAEGPDHEKDLPPVHHDCVGAAPGELFGRDFALGAELAQNSGEVGAEHQQPAVLRENRQELPIWRHRHALDRPKVDTLVLARVRVHDLCIRVAGGTRGVLRGKRARKEADQ